MTTSDLSDIYKYVMVELPRCPKPLIMQTGIEVIREFCHESQAWAYNLDPINIAANVQEYELDGDQPSYADIDAVMEVTLSDVLQRPQEDYSISDTETWTLYLTSEPGSAITAGLEVQVALKPKVDADVIDRRLFEQWHSAWAFGIMSRLMLMPGKAWSEPNLGRLYARRFADGLIQARLQQMRGGMNTPLRANAPSAFRW